MVDKVENEDVRDAAIISAAQRVEHYEMAGYGTARTYATLLEDEEASQLLQKTLDEEKEADEKLTSLAEQINVSAQAGETVATEKTTLSKRKKAA